MKTQTTKKCAACEELKDRIKITSKGTVDIEVKSSVQIPVGHALEIGAIIKDPTCKPTCNDTL